VKLNSTFSLSVAQTLFTNIRAAETAKALLAEQQSHLLFIMQSPQAKSIPPPGWNYSTAPPPKHAPSGALAVFYNSLDAAG
jgi:hypothetical protein